MSSTDDAGEGASLTSILNTPALRTEFALLVALCSDAMRRDIAYTFDPAQQRNSKLSPPVVSQNAYTASAQPDLISVADPSPSKNSLTKEACRECEVEIMTARMQGLQRAALTFFDKWQIDVLRRIGEVLSVRSDAVRIARRDAKARAAAIAKENADLEFLDWANGHDVKIEKEEDKLQKPKVFEGIDTKLRQLDEAKRILIVDSLLFLLLSLKQYTAHSRVLLLRVTNSLQLSRSTLVIQESKVAQTLLATAASQMSADESTKKKSAEDASARRWKVGLATFAGAALIGVTGGLAAPILAASLGSIMGGLGLGAVATLLGPLATNIVLVGGLFGAYGGRMTGRIMEKYAKEVQDFKFIPIHDDVNEPIRRTLSENNPPPLDENEQKKHKLRVAIGVSGWLRSVDDIVEPWFVFNDTSIEPFALRWELDALLQLGESLQSAFKGYAWDFAKFKLMTTLVAGLWPLGLLRMANVLDNPFAIARTRAEKAGRVLADALISKVQGERPVTLVGYSLGAAVIYHCLLELAEHNAFGLIESVCLMGTPAPSDSASWRRIRTVVVGRVVNVYSTDDFMLGFLYRASSAQLGVAGLEEISGVYGVDNLNVTDLVKGHTRYRELVGTILERVNFDELDQDALQQERLAFEMAETQESEMRMKTTARADDNAVAKQVDEKIILVDNEIEESSLPREDSPKQKPHDNKAFRELIELEDSESNMLAAADTTEKSSTFSVDPSKSEVSLLNDDMEGMHVERPSLQSKQSSDSKAKRKPKPKPKPASAEMLSYLDPEPEPDFGPDKETLRFGSSDRGFDLTYER